MRSKYNIENQENIYTLQMITIKINITTIVDHFVDPITLDEFSGTIEKYIDDNTDNIVILYENNRIFLTRRSLITEQYNVAKNQYYGSYYNLDSTRPFENDPNVDKSMIYFNLRSVGLIVRGNYCNIIHLQNNPNLQLFAVYEQKKIYPSVARRNDYIDGSLTLQVNDFTCTSVLLPGKPSTVDNLVKLNQPNSTHDMLLLCKQGNYSTTGIMVVFTLYCIFHAMYIALRIIFTSQLNVLHEMDGAL